MFVLSLEKLIGCVHGEDRQHQYDFCEENDVGIETRPAGHLIIPKAFDFNNISANEKEDACQQNCHGQKFKHVHQQRIEATEVGCEYAVRTSHSIDDEFKYFEVDHEKADIDTEMQESGSESLEHFFL